MKISQLYIHPLKSAAAIEVDSLNYLTLGPKFDRRWMVVDNSNRFVTQRKHPKMCLLIASIHADNLRLSATGFPDLKIEGSGPEIMVSVWHDEVPATDCGDKAAVWVSKVIGKPCRIVELNTNTRRGVDPNFAEQGDLVSFADGFPTLIATQASLDEFNSHLESPVDMRRFRPNIVIDDCHAYAEDAWKAIRIRNIEFKLVKPCSRCIMPSINPDTAVKEMQVNDVLLKTRRQGTKTYFGQNALHLGHGAIRVGDEVTLIK